MGSQSTSPSIVRTVVLVLLAALALGAGAWGVYTFVSLDKPTTKDEEAEKRAAIFREETAKTEPPPQPSSVDPAAPKPTSHGPRGRPPG